MQKERKAYLRIRQWVASLITRLKKSKFHSSCVYPIRLKIKKSCQRFYFEKRKNPKNVRLRDDWLVKEKIPAFSIQKRVNRKMFSSKEVVNGKLSRG